MSKVKVNVKVKCLARNGRYNGQSCRVQQNAITLQYGAKNDNYQSEKCRDGISVEFSR